MSADLSDRYGTSRSPSARVVITLSAVVAAAFLGWVAWAVWFQVTPEVTSELVTSSIEGPNRATAVVVVHVDDDVDADCRIQALAKDHSVVGYVSFKPVDGHNDVVITTEREATSVDLVGCTAKGQKRPR